MPAGLAEIDEGEADGAIHPALDPRLNGLEDEDDEDEGKSDRDRKGPHRTMRSEGGGRGQYREPFEYGAILKALGLDLSGHELAVRYYRERAAPNLIRYPVRETPKAADPLPEGLQTWDVGEPLQEVDWLQSVVSSPVVVPGVTTVQRVWGTSEGNEREKKPVDLDLYVDCSGSMPNPQTATSYLTLAGAIVALSALRVGARVQATLWSGAGEFETTGGFVSDANKVLSILTGYLGGSTAFPIHLLRDTYASRKKGDRAVHVLVISDDGVTTMFDKDEKRNSGWDVARAALEKGGGGGTLVLNLWQEWTVYADLVRANQEGWRIHVVRTWEELVTFARAFSREQWEKKSRG